ncbi:MAG: hypothetical protein M5U19_17795 [Microthrixaceae bacterium]|nr:hypothetical protein [Microthrixaceae bacterium]
MTTNTGGGPVLRDDLHLAVRAAFDRRGIERRDQVQFGMEIPHGLMMGEGVPVSSYTPMRAKKVSMGMAPLSGRSG